MAAEVSRAEIAAAVGVSHTTIGNLCAKGVFKRGKRGYDKDQAILAYCEYIRGIAARHTAQSGGLDLIGERAKLAHAQTEEAELRIATKRGEFIPRGEVERALHGIVRVIRQHVLAIPGRLTLRIPALHKAELQIVDEVTRDALSSIAKTSPEDVFKPSAD